MIPEVQLFIDTWAAKSAAKQEALAAVGAAKFAELDGKDATALWQTVAEKGFSEGEEGRLYAEALAIAERYVKEHADEFVSFEAFVNPESHETLVKLIGLLDKEGRPEEAAKLTMFELVRFERQHIGQAMKAVVRKV